MATYLEQLAKEMNMRVIRQAPRKDFQPELIGDSVVTPLDIAFTRSDESDDDMPNGRIEIHLGSSTIKGESSDRHLLVMSPSEVMLLFASLPSDKIADAAKQFFATMKQFDRGITEWHQPDCAITITEFADRLVELFRATLDWK